MNVTARIWLDGRVVEEEEADVAVAAHGLHYGVSVFEGIRGYAVADGVVLFRAVEHFERLQRSAALLGLRCPPLEVWLNAAHAITVRVGFGDLYLRPLLWAESPSLALDWWSEGTTRSALIVRRWSSYFQRRGELRLVTTGCVRLSEGTRFSQAKIGGLYAVGAAATLAARRAGADEALMLTRDGRVAEAPAANVVMVCGDQLFTPGGDVALAGITRDTVRRIAASMGLRWSERAIDLEALRRCDGLFLCGTACEIRPVTMVNGEHVGGERGQSLIGDIASRYARTVRELSSYEGNVLLREDGWFGHGVARPA